MLCVKINHTVDGDSQTGAGRNTRLHQHTAEFSIPSSTGGAVITHYGRSAEDGAWHLIWTATFTAASNGEKQVATLEHAYDQYKSNCASLTGTGASVLSTMSGA
jgi:hypothetical protein